MSYESQETSVEGGEPTEIYTVTAGAQIWRMTSDPVDVSSGGNTYTAVAGLQRTKMGEGRDSRKRGVTFELPADHELAAEFVGTLPGVRFSVQVDAFHRSDTPTPEVVSVFDGFISDVNFVEEARVAKIKCINAMGSLFRQIPRRTFQVSCNHVLYDDVCGVDDTDAAYRASAVDVVSQVGNVLTVTGLSGTYTDGWFIAGYVEAVGSTDFRLIVGHTADTLTLTLPFGSVPTKVNVFAGCDHTPETCQAKFGNLFNNGGFPWTPSGANPFDDGF